jgi:hypothetical protein
MSSLIMVCLEHLPESISRRYIHWCVFDFARPATLQLLRDLGFTDCAANLELCCDYNSLTQTAFESGWHIDETRHKIEETLTKEHIRLHYRAIRSTIFLGQASMNADNIKHTFFSYEIEQAVFAYKQEDPTQDMMDKLELFCAESGINLNTVISRVSE